VWKVICGEYKETYPNSMLLEDTLKDHLQDGLKECSHDTRSQGLC
jgi:hypothetical protein